MGKDRQAIYLNFSKLYLNFSKLVLHLDFYQYIWRSNSASSHYLHKLRVYGRNEVGIVFNKLAIGGQN